MVEGVLEGFGRQGTVLRRTERESKLLIVMVEQHSEAHQFSPHQEKDPEQADEQLLLLVPYDEAGLVRVYT